MELTFIHHYWHQVSPVKSTELHEQDCAEITALINNEAFRGVTARGIYLATSNAGAGPSISFWKSAIESGVSYALPANFPWTLANAPCSYLARALGVRGPNYTLVGKGNALLAALRHAIRDLHDDEIQLAYIVGVDFGGIDNGNTTAGGFVLLKIPSHISLQFVESGSEAVDIAEHTCSEVLSMLVQKIQNKMSFIFGNDVEGVVHLQHEAGN